MAAVDFSSSEASRDVICEKSDNMIVQNGGELPCTHESSKILRLCVLPTVSFDHLMFELHPIDRFYSCTHIVI